MTVYNNCNITSNNNIIGWTAGPPFTSSFQDVFTHPCDRTDQAYVVPNSGLNNCATVVGAYVICTPPSGFTGTTSHQVEYRAINSISGDLWDDQSSTVYNGVVSGSGTPGTTVATLAACCDVIDLRNMLPSSGDWIVRYRNIYSTSCQQISGTGSTWTGVWHQEIWNL